MTAQTHSLHTVPPINHSIRRRRQIRSMNPLSVVVAELHAEAEMRHRRMIHLEELLRETPIWCRKERRYIREAIALCRPAMWS